MTQRILDAFDKFWCMLCIFHRKAFESSCFWVTAVTPVLHSCMIWIFVPIWTFGTSCLRHVKDVAGHTFNKEEILSVETSKRSAAKEATERKIEGLVTSLQLVLREQHICARKGVEWPAGSVCCSPLYYPVVDWVIAWKQLKPIRSSDGAKAIAKASSQNSKQQRQSMETNVFWNQKGLRGLHLFCHILTHIL